MARFDVYLLPGRKVRHVIDVQSNFLSHLSTRAVVPLMPEGEVGKPAAGLNPIFRLGSELFTFFPQFIASVPVRDLKQRITSFTDYQDEITRALDLLFTGF